MSSPESHYEVLGVDPGAPRDEIREAYRQKVADLKPDVFKGSADDRRERSAAVNRAWNVLSDPYQRRRYDEEHVVGEDDAGDPDADLERNGDGARPSRPVPARSRRGAPGATERGSGGGDAKTPAAPPSTAVTLPTGQQTPEQRLRLTAMLIDVAVLVAILFLVQLVAQPVVKAKYPHEIKQINALQKQQTNADKAASKAGDSAAKAESQAKSATQAGNTAAATEANATVTSQRAEQKHQQQLSKDAKNEISKVQKKLKGAQIAIYVVTGVLALLYLVPITAASGATFGQRRYGIKVVNPDGQPVGWLPALVRYLLPIAIVVALQMSLVGIVVGFAAVLYWLWDKRRQGIHDKLARTYVIQATPPPEPKPRSGGLFGRPR